MSTKLTNYTREQIVKDLLAHRFTKACDKLIRDRAALAVKLYRDFYSRSMLAKIDALPSGWLPESNSIFCQFAGRADRVRFNGWTSGSVAKYCTKSDESVGRRFLASDDSRLVKTYEATDALCIAHADLDARLKDLNDEIDRVSRQARAAVDSATTINRLIELWPEVEPFARKHEAAKAPNLPALPTRELNALLDLPVAA